MKWVKQKELEESLESGAISMEEYEEKKKEIEEMPDEKADDRGEKKEEAKELKLKSDKMLIIGVIIIVLLFAAVFGMRHFAQEKPQTIDDLHALNLKGKLKAEQGYLYKDAY